MGSTVTLSAAFCFVVPQVPGRLYKGCMMNGKLYPLGLIARTQDCYRCSCDEAEMECCSLFLAPVNYDKENCKVVFSKKRCDYDVVQKDDPSKMCNSDYIRGG
ncbi:beta-microseminoprotein-like [Sylvia borin]